MLKDALVESVWVDIKIGRGVKSMLRLGAFYRAGNLFKGCQVEMDRDICDEIRRNSCKQCLIMGDFNLRDYVTCEDSNECRVFNRLAQKPKVLKCWAPQGRPCSIPHGE